MRQYANVKWLAIDDNPKGYPPECPELILCDPFVGMDEKSAAAIRKWLEE